MGKRFRSATILTLWAMLGLETGNRASRQGGKIQKSTINRAQHYVRNRRRWRLIYILVCSAVVLMLPVGDHQQFLPAPFADFVETSTQAPMLAPLSLLLEPLAHLVRT